MGCVKKREKHPFATGAQLNQAASLHLNGGLNPRQESCYQKKIRPQFKKIRNFLRFHRRPSHSECPFSITVPFYWRCATDQTQPVFIPCHQDPSEPTAQRLGLVVQTIWADASDAGTRARRRSSIQLCRVNWVQTMVVMSPEPAYQMTPETTQIIKIRQLSRDFLRQRLSIVCGCAPCPRCRICPVWYQWISSATHLLHDHVLLSATMRF